MDRRRDEAELETIDELKAVLGRNTANLNEIERRVLMARFAIDQQTPEDPAAEPKTLEQVGEMIGVTKERVRQIQNKALGKLRQILESGPLVA